MKDIKKFGIKEHLIDNLKGFLEWVRYEEFNLGVSFRDIIQTNDINYAENMFNQFLDSWNSGKINENSMNIYWDEPSLDDPYDFDLSLSVGINLENDNN